MCHRYPINRSPSGHAERCVYLRPLTLSLTVQQVAKCQTKSIAEPKRGKRSGRKRKERSRALGLPCHLAAESHVYRLCVCVRRKGRGRREGDHLATAKVVSSVK